MSAPKTLINKTGEPSIDFDQWANLAKADPEAFEARRAEAIETLIASLPAHKQQRMRCLQWKVDQTRNRAANPMAACIKLSEMMWDSLVGPGGLREAFERTGKKNFALPPKARVLGFRSPH